MATISDSTAKEAFDTKALNGLRGLAAVHICIYHSLLQQHFNSFGNVNIKICIPEGIKSYIAKHFRCKCSCSWYCQDLVWLLDMERKSLTGMGHWIKLDLCHIFNFFSIFVGHLSVANKIRVKQNARAEIVSLILKRRFSCHGHSSSTE